MPELMTKQDAIEYLLYMKHGVQAKSPMAIALDTAIEALKAKPVSRWIPCIERMPEENTQVLCYCKFGDFRIMEFDEQDGRWYEGIHDYRKQSVTHWMPLPEPPGPCPAAYK